MQPAILRDPDATNKLLEAILEAPNGKRMVSRLARTCRAFCEPALNVLWRDLDSLVPILWQFPGHLLKKARKPGMGFVKTPSEEDWNSVLKYSERVRQISYNERSNAVSASVFAVLEESRPRSYFLPHLEELNWKVETPAGLARCALFLNPELRAVNLEIGSRLPQLDSFLSDLSNRTKLTSFSFVSPTSLPDSFTDIISRQLTLEKVVLVAPGALAPGVGRWVASLPRLKNLRLDLTGRSVIAVEGFFDELHLQSGDSTPSSVTSTDSGVFSGDEDDDVDFSLIRKSALHLTGNLRSKGSFAQMRKLHLTGDVSNIAVFIKHITTPLTQLELVIEDPPDRADWHDLSSMICEKFGESLQTLRVIATSASRFIDLVRSTNRAEPPSGRLSMEHLTYLPCLTRLEIDLPESVIFTEEDVRYIAKACPNVEILKLCPLAGFPAGAGAPQITLDDIAHLVRSCKNLHTLATVIDANGKNTDILTSRGVSSKSLLRLHVGHSWLDDPLQVAILMSHIAPHLETLKWFQEKNRPGFIEANARSWQKVSELLPHLQGVRQLERQFASATAVVIPVETAEKSIDATTKTVDRGVHVYPRMRNNSAQVSATLVSQVVQTQSNYTSTGVYATPSTVDVAVEAIKTLVSQEVDAVPELVTESVEATPPNIIIKSVQALLTPSTFSRAHSNDPFPFFIIPSILNLFSLAYRLFIFYPLSLPSQILHIAAARIRSKQAESKQAYPIAPPPEPTTTATTDSDIPLDTLVVEVRD